MINFKEHLMKFNSLEEQWDYWGHHLGYKPCCVKSFLEGKQIHESVFSGTGFLPCKECDKLPVSEVLSYIDIHRKSKVPFPFDKEYHNESSRKSCEEINSTLRKLP